MQTKSADTKAELLRTALLAQTNLRENFKLLMEAKKEGEKTRSNYIRRLALTLALLAKVSGTLSAGQEGIRA